MIRLDILGAGQDVGRSCILLTISNRSILLDCGAHPGFADSRRFPNFDLLPHNSLASLDAVLISHFHFDHAAALPSLTEKTECSAPVYMTKPTIELSRLMLQDFVSTSKARNQFCPFDHGDIQNCLSKVKLLELNEEVFLGKNSDISVRTFYAGHVIGAVMFLIKCEGRSVLFSGDYSTKSDRQLLSANIPTGIKPDVFITEATYCSTIRQEGRLHSENEMMGLVRETLQKRGKILIPISAFGRVQAMCSIFSAHSDKKLFDNVPMYVVSGLASKANDSYRAFEDWTVRSTDGCSQCSIATVGRRRSRFAAKCGHNLSAKLQSFNRNEHWHLIHSRNPMILFATPGNLSTGLSLDVFRAWAANPNNLVIVPAYCFANTVASQLLCGTEIENTSTPSVQCRLCNMTTNSHTDTRGIIRTCRLVNAKTVVLVHGEKTKILKFREQLNAALGVPCFAPGNGDVLKIGEKREDERVTTLTNDSEGVSEEWQSVIAAYEKFVQLDPRSHSGHIT